MKVSIKNFQSIEDGELVIEGLTVLVGKSNIGKSAVIRAISGALENRQGTDFVTEGQTHTEVRLEVPQGAKRPGLDLVWRKGGGHNDYVINGEELGSVGRGSPPQVAAAGFSPLEIGRETVNVQVADQFSPLFLLDASGAVAAEAISDVGRLAEVQEALRSCDKDRRDKKAEKKVRVKDLADAEADLASFDKWPSHLSEIRSLQEEWAVLQTKMAQVATLERLCAERDRRAAEIRSLQGVEGLDVPAVPESFDTAPRRMVAAARLRKQHQALLPEIDRLAGVGSVVLPEFPETVVGAMDRLQTASSLLERARSSFQTVKALGGVDEVSLPELPNQPEAQERQALLEDLIARMHTHARAGKESQVAVAELEGQISDLDTQLHDVLHDLGVCPTCGKEV